MYLSLRLFIFLMNLFSDEDGANCGDDATPNTSGNVREDLSDWQERHATLVLSKVKVFSVSLNLLACIFLLC